MSSHRMRNFSSAQAPAGRACRLVAADLPSPLSSRRHVPSPNGRVNRPRHTLIRMTAGVPGGRFPGRERHRPERPADGRGWSDARGTFAAYARAGGDRAADAQAGSAGHRSRAHAASGIGGPARPVRRPGWLARRAAGLLAQLERPHAKLKGHRLETCGSAPVDDFVKFESGSPEKVWGPMETDADARFSAVRDGSCAAARAS